MRDDEIPQHLGLVHTIAREVYQWNQSIDLEDLVGYGTIGLIQAARVFDESRGLSFSTLAAPRIRGAILDELRRRNGRFEWSWRRQGTMVALEPAVLRSLPHGQVGEDERSVERVTLETALSSLPERTQTILRLYYVEELPQAEIGARFGISGRHVQTIRQDALRRLRPKLVGR